MRNIFILIFLQLFIIISNAQLKWCNPKPSGYINYKIYFLNNNTGLMMDANGDLFRTTDTANHWQLQQNFPNAQTMNLKDSTGIIPTYDGTIYITSDNGTTWQRKQTGINNLYNWADVVSRDTIFLVNQDLFTYYNKLYRSSDRGNTWQLINGDLGMVIPTVDFVNSQVGYGRKYAGICKTVDGGITWQLQYPITTSAGITALKFFNPNIGYAYHQYNDMLKTADGGNTWTASYVPFDINDIFFVSATTAFACGDDGVVYRTTDGGNNWNWLNPPGVGDAEDLYSTFFFNDSSGFVVGHRGRILRTTNGGAIWQQHSPTYTDLTAMSFGNNNTGYVTTRNYIYKSVDKGETWSPLSFTTGLDYASSSRFDHCIFFSSDTGILTSASSPKCYRTVNGGQNWTTTFSFNPGFYDYVSGISFPNGITGYLALHGGLSGLYKTTSGGLNWQEVGNFQNLKKLHFVNDSVGYATQYNSGWRTVDSGKTWTQVLSTDLGTDDAIWFCNARKGFIAGGQGNLKMTTDSGATWTTPVIFDNQYRYFRDIRFFNDTIGYFTTEYGQLYKSIDGGSTWKVWAKTPWDCNSIWFAKDTNIYLAGIYGGILNARIDEYRIDSLKTNQGLQCNISFSAKISSVLSPVDSIWFEFGTTGYTNTIIASPFSVLNTTVLSLATPQGLSSNTQYILRVRVLYKGNYFYSDSIHFSTPALTTPMITANGNILSSSATSGNQWFLNGAAITGATNQQYTATTPGVYTVQATSNGCLTMSAAYNYMVTGVIDLIFNNEIIVFPNPVRNILTIKNPATRKLEINLSDLQGRLLKRSRFSVQQYDLSLKSIPSGVYLLCLLDLKTGQSAAKKIVKL
jgi:photosystem II stability/assembly factor-like uncharacterized protein